MPMLPCIAATERWHERGVSLNTTKIPFLGLADEVCLHCASPLNSDCGFLNLALKNVAMADGGSRWRIETLACMCSHCDQATAELDATGLDDADRRARLLDRHRFDKLDALLDVDAPPAEQRRFEVNSVPVLELRRILLDERRFAWTAGICAEIEVERALYRHVFCSFGATVAWLADDGAEQRKLLLHLAADRQALERRFQLNWPAEVDLFDGKHWILAALVVRVATALRLSDAVQRNLNFGYDTDPATQWLVLMLTMFADTHLDLHLLCDLFARYDDDWIETPLMEQLIPSEQMQDRRSGQVLLNEVIQFPPLLMAYPHPLRCVYAGELMDATCAVASSNLWTDVQEKNKSQVNSFVHIFLNKAGNHRVSLCNSVATELRKSSRLGHSACCASLTRCSAASWATSRC